LRRCHRGSFATTFAYYWETWFNSRFHKYDSVSAFIPTCRFLADKAIAVGCDPRKVFVVPNGLDPAPREKAKGPGKFFLYAGRLSEEKGLPVLIKAFPKDRGELVVAGDGTEEAAYKALAKGHSNIRFVGKQTHSQMRALYRDCLAVVMPSIWHENASMTVLEALANAKPVIATRMGGLPEQIQDGHNGFIYDPWDVESLSRILRRFLEEEGLAEGLGKNARQVFEERYTLERNYSLLMDIYECVMRERKKEP